MLKVEIGGRKGTVDEGEEREKVRKLVCLSPTNPKGPMPLHVQKKMDMVVTY